jgi:uncharacterized protein DUF1707
MPISDEERERAVEQLQRACGEGRMDLEEFGARAGAVWAAETHEELDELMADIAPPPPVGSNQPVAMLSAVMSEHKQKGRWRLPRHVKVRAMFGSALLDLRQATIAPETLAAGAVDIDVRCVCGEAKIVVPEGVEVEMDGGAVMGSRSLKLAAVPRRQGTPLVRIHTNVIAGEVTVRSAPPDSTSKLGQWIQSIVDD